jgi:hypothetical protein
MKPAARPPLPRRGSSLAFGLLAVLALAGLAALLHALLTRVEGTVRRQAAQALVQSLQLTDLAWFTEARYTRHLSQADLHTAFQDGPAALEHFPAGSLVGPIRPTQPAGFAPDTR